MDYYKSLHVTSADEPISIEVIQLSSPESSEENILLSLFEHNARLFFFPARTGKGPRLGQDQTLLLETISDRLVSTKIFADF